jgi:hypothetical protein
MALNIHTQPNSDMVGYSPIPLRYSSTNNNNEGFKYVTTLFYNKIDTTSVTTTLVNNEIYTLITTNGNHNFNTGDIIFLEDTSTTDGIYTGYYNIISVPATNSIVIDMILSVGITTSVNVSQSIKYQLPKDIDGECKFDLSNVLKDYVTYTFIDNDDDFSGESTRFDYNLYLGEKSIYSIDFTDNTFVSGGNVGFITTEEPVFEVGDSIRISQDIVEFDYDDNKYLVHTYPNGTTAGLLGFYSTTDTHNFRVGQQIEVTGQITEPYYNGAVTIVEVIDNQEFIVDKTFTTSTPAESGKIYGNPRPEYNGVFNVVSVTDNGDGTWTIEVNNPFTDASGVISGKISYADGREVEQFDIEEISGLTTYNSYVERENYTQTYMDEYVISTTGKSISTIIDTTNQYRVESTTKQWLLTHFDEVGTKELVLRVYNSSGSLLSVDVFTLNNTDKSVYVPVGLEQLRDTSMVNSTIYPPFTHYLDNNQIDYYTIEVRNNSQTKVSDLYTFELNDDCSRYDIYHLCWLDKMGSFISYPFIYKSRESSEYDRKSYYQREGSFNTSNDTYGFNEGQGGEQTFISREREKLILNSGWAEDFETELIKDMLGSSKVLIQEPNGKMYGCTITNNEYNFKNKNNDDLFNYTISVSYNNNKLRY